MLLLFVGILNSVRDHIPLKQGLRRLRTRDRRP